jgi:hypothetical protein
VSPLGNSHLETFCLPGRCVAAEPDREDTAHRGGDGSSIVDPQRVWRKTLDRTVPNSTGPT